MGSYNIGRSNRVCQGHHPRTKCFQFHGVFFFLENIGLLALLGIGTHLKSLGSATYYVLPVILVKCPFNISKDYDLKYNNYYRGR